MKNNVRWMIRKDIPDILEIEDKTKQWDGMSEDNIVELTKAKNNIAMVSEEIKENKQKKIFGFIIYNIHHETLTILALNGYDKVLTAETCLQNIISKKLNSKRKEVIYDTTEDETKLHLKLKEMGFRAVKVVRKVYPERDLYRFVYQIKQINDTKNELESVITHESTPS